ncbi:MAG: hypothetical protein JWM11_838 [Planctomycetaceae bacterium]|nr:hypothetical protein [Planctomycetaceae bacterium]
MPALVPKIRDRVNSPDKSEGRMDVERSLHHWRRTAIIGLLASAGLLAALVAIVVIPLRITPLTDDRLIGTWQSDAERTIAGMQRGESEDPQREAKLRNLFGKLRVTYAATTYTSELDESVNTYSYQVLGRDRHSVVISDAANKESPLDFLELSTFTVIHFDSPDSYWLNSEAGGMREYFKRVR